MKKFFVIPLLILLSPFYLNAQYEFASCDEITKSNDKFEDIVRYSTPTSTQFGGFISALKVIDGDNSRVYLRLYANGQTLNVDEKGVILLFDDGSKLEWPTEKLEVEYKDFGYGNTAWRYSAFILLNDEEISMLSSKTINSYRLYIYDIDVSSTKKKNVRNKTNFMNQVSCLITLD